jgi:hypothetical protein
MDQEVKTSPEQEQSQQTPSAANADLNLSDLASLRSILEVASSRGAFKAAELEAVGKSYNKLNTFLESVAAKKE